MLYSGTCQLHDIRTYYYYFPSYQVMAWSRSALRLSTLTTQLAWRAQSCSPCVVSGYQTSSRKYSAHLTRAQETEEHSRTSSDMEDESMLQSKRRKPITPSRQHFQEITQAILDEGNLRYWTSKEWSEFYEKHIDSQPWWERMKEASPLHLLSCLTKVEKRQGLLDLGQSLYDYVKGRNADARWARAIDLLCRTSMLQLMQNQCTDRPDIDDALFGMYCDLRRDFPLLDIQTCTDLSRLLGRTKHWRESYNLIDMAALSGQYFKGVHEGIIKGASRTRDIDAAYKVFTDLNDRCLSPTDNIYLTFLAHMETSEEMTRFLAMLGQYDWIVSKTVAFELKNWIERYLLMVPVIMVIGVVVLAL